MKDQNNEVNDIVIALYVEISDIASSMEVLMMAIGEQFAKCSTSKQKGKVKIPKPRPYARKRDAQKLENFVIDMNQYF